MAAEQLERQTDRVGSAPEQARHRQLGRHHISDEDSTIE
jgi:hypothetical protein